MALTGNTKVVFVFEQEAYGWTETHWLPSISTDFQSQLDAALVLAPKMMACRTKDCSMTHIRLSDGGNQRRYRLEPLGPVIKGTRPFAQTSVPTAALVKLRDVGFTSTGQFFLRGISDEDIIISELRMKAAWKNGPFKSLLTAMAGVWGWPSRIRASQKKATVASLTQLLPSFLVQIDVTTDTFPGPYDGSGPNLNVFLSGMTGSRVLNGQHIVQAKSLTRAVTVRQIPIGPYVANSGKLTLNTPGLILVGSGIPERIDTRKVGRPLYQSAGRRQVLHLV